MLKYILFIVLSCATLFCHFNIERYEIIGPQVSGGHWHKKTFQGQSIQISENEIILFSDRSDNSTRAYQKLSAVTAGTTLMVSAHIMCKNVKQGEKPWDQARLILIQNDGRKNRWDYPHGVASIVGSNNWTNSKALFTIQPETKKIRLEAHLSRTTGTFRLKDINVYPVIQTSLYAWAKIIILCSWGLFALFLIGSLFLNKTGSATLKALLVVTFMTIVIGIAVPGKIKTKASEKVISQLHGHQIMIEKKLPTPIQKYGHFIFFVIFAAMLGLLLKEKSAVFLFSHILMLAAGTELAQFFIDGRGPGLMDFLIDITGGAMGIITFRILKQIPLVKN